MFSQISQLQQNLNQIAQICDQLSQNEQSNVSKLTQMQQAESNAAQQLRHCAQLCHQVSQQVSQAVSSTQFAGAGQQVSTYASPYTGGVSTSSWANRPINTSMYSPSAQFGSTGQQYGMTGQQYGMTGQQYGMTGQFGGGFAGQSAAIGQEAPPTGRAAFNTNKDLNQ